MKLVTLSNLAFDEFMKREAIREKVASVIDGLEPYEIHIKVTIPGAWIIDKRLGESLELLFPERFKNGIERDKLYEFNPQEAEYAGIITEA